MATTVRQLFNEFNILDFRNVKWGEIFNEKGQGVYVASSSNDPDKHLGITENPLFDDKQINLWISKLPNFQIDGFPADPSVLKNRLTSFWLADESILYIGKAPTRKNGTGISKRVIEYFSTIIGDRGPHSGGQWVKVLKNLNTFTIYYGVCANPAEIEHKMLDFFMSNVSRESKLKLYDKVLKIPFANINHKGNKSHGMKNQRH